MNPNWVQRIIKHEGFSPKAYRDPKGILTIGYGFNLTRPDADLRLTEIGKTAHLVKSGGATITRDEALHMALHDLRAAYMSAKHFVPDLDAHHPEVQFIVVDLFYNMGQGRVAKFPGFLRAIRNRLYSLAALELLFRKLGAPEMTGYWFDTKTRAQQHASTLGLLDMEQYAAARAQFPQEGVPG